MTETWLDVTAWWRRGLDLLDLGVHWFEYARGHGELRWTQSEFGSVRCWERLP